MAVRKHINTRPTRKEVDLFYKTHRSQFVAPERVHVLQIVKNFGPGCDRETAMEIMQRAQERLRSGEPFATVADEISDCRGSGGDLGWFARGVMVEEFEDLVFEMKPGETSGIFETVFGLHIVHFLERREPGIVPLREVYEQIADVLERNRMQGQAQ